MANETIYPYGQGATMPAGYPIANDLNTNDAQQALSAAMGVELKSRINNAGGDNSSIIKARSKQMSQVEWTPLRNIKMNSNNTTLVTKTAGTKFKGLPYSSVKEYDKFIGYDVSLYTFLTAVNNPYSLFYTECTMGTASASAIDGRTYHGVNCATYFGVVCNIFAQFCSMAPVPFSTSEHAWQTTHKGDFSRINDQSAQGVAVGDIVWSSGHDRCITDVVRDASGKVTGVTITEAVWTVVTLTDMTAAQFDTYIANKKCIIYRYTGLSPIYIPSPFVAGKDETIGAYTYNDDICTFAGDKACFKVGDVIRINFNLTDDENFAYTKMQIFKGEIGSRTQVGSDITLDSTDLTNHYVDLTNQNLPAGLYAARMSDGTNHSDYTYFEVVEAIVSATVNNGITRITFSSTNGKPLYYGVCNIDGTPYAKNGLTDEDRLRGYVDVDLTALNAAQHPSSPFVSGTTYYVKVHFEGQYGRVSQKVVKP